MSTRNIFKRTSIEVAGTTLVRAALDHHHEALAIGYLGGAITSIAGPVARAGYRHRVRRCVWRARRHHSRAIHIGRRHSSAPRQHRRSPRRPSRADPVECADRQEAPTPPLKTLRGGGYPEPIQRACLVRSAPGGVNRPVDRGSGSSQVRRQCGWGRLAPVSRGRSWWSQDRRPSVAGSSRAERGAQPTAIAGQGRGTRQACEHVDRPGTNRYQGG